MIVPHETTSPAMQRILALLAEKAGMSASDLSREAFVGLTTLACGGYLKALRAKRLIHVSGWRKTRKGFVTPLFSLGDRPDLPRPVFKDEDRDSEGMNRIVSVLEKDGPMTYRQVAEATGLSPNTIKNARYMALLPYVRTESEFKPRPPRDGGYNRDGAQREGGREFNRDSAERS